MGHERTNGARTTTVDLAGLPEPVADDIRRLVNTLRTRLPSVTPPTPRPSLRGRFAGPGLSIPKADIDAAQQEAWAAFPREFPK